jgi:putative transposase
MARRRRVTQGGLVYHVCNRGSRKGPLFRSSDEYIAFIRLLAEARALRPMRITAYCLMPNHWHLLLWPERDGELSKFMHWLTGAHAAQWRRVTRSQGEGAVYQSRFTAVAVIDLPHLFTVWRYVERNPVEAGLVSHAEDWPWSSAAQWNNPLPDLPLDLAPIARPLEWSAIVNGADVDIRSCCTVLEKQPGRID